jgi:hypothetical protein
MEQVGMNTLNLSTSVSPRVGALLTRITETPDLDTALWKVLAEYVDFKTQALRQQVRTFEQKWGMPFAEFAQCVETETLGQDPYTYEVESDFWEWEAAETLLDHYVSLRPRWM